MKKRCTYRFLALALLVLLSFLLSACDALLLPTSRSTVVSIDDFLVKSEGKDNKTLNLTTTDAFVGTPIQIQKPLMITEEEKDGTVVRRVYNYMEKTCLYTEEKGGKVGFISTLLEQDSCTDGIFYVIVDNTVSLYNVDGSLALTGAYDESAPNFIGTAPNGFSFNGVEYTVRDGKVLFESTDPLAGSFFRMSDFYNGRYYYVTDTKAFVFSENGTLLYEYLCPSYAEKSVVYVLSGGNLLIQYLYEVPQGEEYNLLFEDGRYKLVSLLVNPSKKTESEQELSFLVTDLLNPFYDAAFHDTYTDLVSNFALICPIENKCLDAKTSSVISLSDALVTVFTLSDVVRGAQNITPVSDDRYRVSTQAGDYLASGDGTVLGQLNNTSVMTERYIVACDYVYDYNLAVVWNAGAEGYRYFGRAGDNLLFTGQNENENTLYLFKGEGAIAIGEVASYVAFSEGYALKVEGAQGETTCNYYDEDGHLLLSTASPICWAENEAEANGDELLGYATDEAGKTVYYLLSFIKTQSGR